MRIDETLRIISTHMRCDRCGVSANFKGSEQRVAEQTYLAGWRQIRSPEDTFIQTPNKWDVCSRKCAEAVADGAFGRMYSNEGVAT